MLRKGFLLLIILSLGLTGCTYFTFLSPTATTSTTATQTTTSSMTETTESTTTSLSTTATITTSTTTTTSPTTQTTNTEESSFVLEEYETLQDAYDDADEVISMPSTGNVKGLVFAIDFSNYPAANDSVTLSDLQMSFNGSSEDLPYESLKSYYSISSSEALNLTFDIYGFYRAEYATSHYVSEYDDNGNPASDLVLEVLGYYNAVIDYSQYDANNDGYIDALYLIYTAPVSFNYGSDLWWAYMDVCVYTDLFDGMEPYYFVFAGTDFFEETPGELDARTIIHETGHLLGLDDYYDYDDTDAYNSGGLGGADMMDNTMGDMNPFSKLLLGWIQPTVITGTGTFTLPEYVETGDVFLVIPEWRGTIFDEYLLICYYTPEGLYEEDQWEIFWTEGILIYHVDARIGQGFDEEAAYWTIFNYNNTDTLHKLIKIIEADQNGAIDGFSRAENTDLFQAGDILGENVYPDYVWYQSIWNPMDLTISIGIQNEYGIPITIVRNPS